MNPTVEKLAEAISRWLSNEGGAVQKAVEETVSEGLFSRADCIYALRALRSTTTAEHIENWLEGRITNAKVQDVLVLHAGNLPLVGFQDILAVILSGNRYNGKFSKKDRFLPASFIPFLREVFPDQTGVTGVETDRFSGTHRFLIFSGSEASAAAVLHWARDKNLLTPDAKTLMRTAQFSIAFLEELNDGNMADLTSAMLRYGGKGCRSIAVVVCGKPFKSNQCSIVDHAESFWISSPAKIKSGLSKAFHAYYRAAGFPLTMVDHFMMVETTPDPSIPNTVFYVTGGFETLEKLLIQFGNSVQTVYTVDGRILHGLATEKLENAQNPPLSWKPDGIDTLGWLLES